MILPTPHVTPLWSFCSAPDRAPGLPKPLSLPDQLARIASLASRRRAVAGREAPGGRAALIEEEVHEP